MKSLVFLLTICVIVFLSACAEPEIIILQCVCAPGEEGEPSGNQPPVNDLFMSASVDGRSWSAVVDGSALSASLSGGNEIVAFDTDHTSQITLRLPKELTVAKVYTITKQGESTAFYTPNPAGGVPVYYGSTSGNVTIKGIDSKHKMIGGTFSFTGVDAKTGRQIIITDGIFKLTTR